MTRSRSGSPVSRDTHTSGIPSGTARSARLIVSRKCGVARGDAQKVEIDRDNLVRAARIDHAADPRNGSLAIDPIDQRARELHAWTAQLDDICHHGLRCYV